MDILTNQMLCFAYFLTSDEKSQEAGVSQNFFGLRDQIMMADNTDRVSDDASIFGDSSDEESFYGFPVGENNSNNNSDNSDRDFSDLWSDEEENKGYTRPQVGDEEDPDKLQWLRH